MPMTNYVNLLGRTTRDVVTRYTKSGTKVVTFTLAVDRRMAKLRKLEAIDNNRPTADFIRCIAYGKKADILEEYVKKGARIQIEGRLETDWYVNKDNVRVYTTDVIINNFEIIDFKSRDEDLMKNRELVKDMTQESFRVQEDFIPINDDRIPF